MQPGNQWRNLEVDGRERRYVLRIPPGYDNSPMPVVIAIHGAMSNPTLMEQFSGLSEYADQQDFILVYAAGTGNLSTVLTWNGGNCCGYAVKHQVDDIAYFRALLADLTQTVAVDADRVYLAGMSNGAHMAYRLCSEWTEPFAAAACVAGPMAMETCRPSRPIPILHIHGTEDEFAPFHGGRGAKSAFAIEHFSVPDTIRKWVEANGCPTVPAEERWPDRVGDGTSVIRQAYGPGKNGVEVVLMVVENGGHTWPGRPPLPLTLGKSTMNFHANEVIWQFFQKHRRV